MGSTRRALEPNIKLSPRELQLADALFALKPNEWAENSFLCSFVFGDNVKNWPLNARQMITGAMNGLQRKLLYHHSNLVIHKRGNGGRAGIEYRFKQSKGTLR